MREAAPFEARGVRKRLGARTVLSDIELTIGAGEAVCVVGANGSGKSTLLRVACGILEPDAGEIRIAGHSLAAHPSLAKAALGYAPDGLETLPELRVSELVRLVRSLRALPATPSAYDALWLDRLGVPELWGERLRALSFGQRKRVGIAVAAAGEPALLLLDEPTNGLDPSGAERVLELMNERRAHGRSALVATNDVPFAGRLGAKAYRLEAGRLELAASAARDG